MEPTCEPVRVGLADHPMEAARLAILTAAELEGPAWAAVMVRFAEALPPRKVTEEA